MTFTNRDQDGPEGVGPDAFVTVQVSRELLAMMTRDGWTGPVQVRIEPIDHPEVTHTMAARHFLHPPMLCELEHLPATWERS